MVRVKNVNPMKGWLAEFLLTRGYFSGPDGQPLYSYQLTGDELGELVSRLKVNVEMANDVVYRGTWAACYCLFVSERYRRFYDAGSGGWSWQEFDELIGLRVTAPAKAKIVEDGLVKYWKRKIIVSEKGRDLLGSLFLEGGLPWQLVQSDNHGFGRAVRRGLRHMYSASRDEQSLAGLFAAHEGELPQSFQNLQTRQLLAGIVTQLVDLAETLGLDNQADAAGYLDQVQPDWKKAFPIPLDEGNSRTLINDWLLLAGKSKKERKEAVEQSRWFSCEHHRLNTEELLCLEAVIYLPKDKAFSIDRAQVHSTRLSVLIYEGECLLSTVGVVYGKLEDAGLNVRFPKTKVHVKRKDPTSHLVFKLQTGGVSVVTEAIVNSELDVTGGPLIFVKTDEVTRLVGNESCVVQEDKAIVYVPSGAVIRRADGLGEPVNYSSACWIEVSDDTVVEVGGEKYVVEFRHGIDEGKPVLVGKDFGFDRSLPNVVYRGWPRLTLPSQSEAENEKYRTYINGSLVKGIQQQALFGSVQFSVRDGRGNLVLKRKFGVLPQDFRISSFPADHSKPAKLVLKSAENLHVEVAGAGLQCKAEKVREGTELQLIRLPSYDSTHVSLLVSSEGLTEPLKIVVPYPSFDAQLIDGNGEPVTERQIALDDLLGKRIVLSSDGKRRRDFLVHFQVMGLLNPPLARTLTFSAFESPIDIHLHDLSQDIMQMLSVLPDQDMAVRVTVSSTTQLLDFKVMRYNSVLEQVSRTRYEARGLVETGERRRVVADAMLLSDPKQSPVPLTSLVSEGVTTGQFEVPLRMESAAPWLIYPSARSSVKFRPKLFFGSEARIDSVNSGSVTSLHQACQVYHPEHNPDAIDEQIALMAKNLDHSGWQYLADLRSKYSHLSLSTFEVWKALAKNDVALVLAIFRLEFDEVFSTRIQNELATIWEVIPIHTWKESYTRYKGWIDAQGLPESLVMTVMDNRISVLSEVVSSFREFSGFIRSGEQIDLPPVPPLELLLPGWYQSMRVNHASNDKWPTELSRELGEWLSYQSLSSAIKSIPNISYAQSVAILPLFTAHVTVGRALLSDLHHSEAYLIHSIRILSDFDRVNWYNPVHALMVAFLLKQDSEGSTPA